MTLEKIKENHELLMKLPVHPKSLRLAGQYVQNMFTNFIFETMNENEHLESIKLFTSGLERYRKIKNWQP